MRPGDILLKVNGNAPKDISGHIGISDIYPTAQTLNITVQRKTNIFSVVITKSLHTSNTGRIYTRNLENDTILYLRIPHFYKPENKSSTSTMAEEVHAILTDWKNSAAGAEGLLIDLRQNIGGSVLAALELANIFIPKSVALQIKTAKGIIKPIKTTEEKALYSGPIIILVDEKTASASEIFSAAMQDHGVALIVGNKTYGKGFMQSIVSFETDFSRDKAIILEKFPDVPILNNSPASMSGMATITSGQLYRATGISLHKKGITPDQLWEVLPIPTS